MDKNVYLHGIYFCPNSYEARETKQKLKEILASDALLSRRKQNLKDTYGFNGFDYISLCDYSKINDNCLDDIGIIYTSYQSIIRSSLSLVFPKENINAISTKQVELPKSYNEKYEIMSKLGLSKDNRFSDLYDEVQIKDELPLKLMTAITLPVHKMNKYYFSEQRSTESIIKELYNIKDLLLKYNYDVPLYDVDSKEELKDDSYTRKLIKYYYYYKK